jgi:pyridoxine/pyridoxamine 5'-phosphate oxidase
MALNVAGTPKKLTIEGISFNLAADVDIEQIFTQFENTAIPSTGPAMRKMVKRTADSNGFVILTNADERKSLKLFAEATSPVQFTWENRAGDTSRCLGIIEITNNQTAENRTTVNVMPVDDWAVSIGG